MIKHVVMYKLNDPNEENALALKEKFLSMRGKIKELLSIDAGTDILHTDRSYNVVLICEFNTVADMDAYQNNPIHLEVKSYVKSVVSQAKSVDYEF